MIIIIRNTRIPITPGDKLVKIKIVYYEDAEVTLEDKTWKKIEIIKRKLKT